MAPLLAEALEIPEDRRAEFPQIAPSKLIVDRSAGVLFTSWRPCSSNIPGSPTPLFGRQPELAEIARLFADSDRRMLTLIGQGGSSKTRLAVEAAKDQQSKFPDGAYFVLLDGVNAAEFIPPAVPDTLGMTSSGPTSPARPGREFAEIPIQRFFFIEGGG